MMTVGQMSQELTTKINAIQVTTVTMAEQTDAHAGPFVRKRPDQELKAQVAKNPSTKNQLAVCKRQAGPKAKNGEEGNKDCIKQCGRANREQKQGRPSYYTKKISTLLVVKNVTLTLTSVSGRMLRPRQVIPMSHGSQPVVPVKGKANGPSENEMAITPV